MHACRTTCDCEIGVSQLCVVITFVRTAVKIVRYTLASCYKPYYVWYARNVCYIGKPILHAHTHTQSTSCVRPHPI